MHFLHKKENIKNNYAIFIISFHPTYLKYKYLYLNLTLSFIFLSLILSLIYFMSAIGYYNSQ